MAMVTLKLDKDVWQEIGSLNFVGVKKPSSGLFELTTAATLPIGSVLASMLHDQKEKLYYPADVSGDAFYIRCISEDKSSFTFYEA